MKDPTRSPVLLPSCLVMLSPTSPVSVSNHTINVYSGTDEPRNRFAREVGYAHRICSYCEAGQDERRIQRRHLARVRASHMCANPNKDGERKYALEGGEAMAEGIPAFIALCAHWLTSL